jgi:PAS domain S-box-containing protein
VGYIVVHHGLVGVLDPTSVYNHPAAWANPWLWAGIHGAFILAMSVVCLITWRLNERAHELTQVVLDSAGEGIVGVDLEGRATFVNAAAARMLERSADELIGQHLGSLALDPPDPPEAACRLYAGLGPEAPSPVEDTFRTRSERRFPVEYLSSEIRERGQLTGAVVVFKDVTRRWAEREALSQSEAQLRQAQKMEAIGQLAGGIAHDFNNLLSIIIGRGELLGNRMKSRANQEAVELIVSTARRAATLTGQLLAFSRQQMLQPRALDLIEVVTGMATMLRRLIGEHIELTTVADRAAGLVHADAAQIQQVIPTWW